MNHLAELLIVMTDDLKGATGGDKIRSTKKPMEGVLELIFSNFTVEFPILNILRNRCRFCSRLVSP